MCKGNLHDFLAALPKCEHHLHLEGCLSPRLLFTLAKKHAVTLPDLPHYASVEALDKRYESFESLQDFLDCYYVAMSVLIDMSDFETLAWEYYENAHRDGVHHAEVFFDPQFHTDRGIPFDVVLQGFSAAGRKAEEKFGMSTQLIMCFLRHLPAASANETLKEAIDSGAFASKFVAGVGLDSSEVGFPPNLFTEPYTKAKGLGIRRTAHAGEEGDTSYIEEALDLLGVERIDHGVRLPEDPRLMARIAAEKVLLTVCPLSNVSLRCVKKVADLPIRTFLEAGVQFSINSDDPAYFGGYILNNYCAVQEAFDLQIKDWITIATSAVKGSWITQERQSELLKLITDCEARYS